MSWHYFYVARVEFKHEAMAKVNASDVSRELERLIRALRPLGLEIQRVSVTVEEGPQRST